MRTLEHRRHSERDPGAAHLNEAGRQRARSVGAGLPRFDRVVTSPAPRAIETAEALGLRVDATVVPLLEMLEQGEFSSLNLTSRTFEESASGLGRDPQLAAFAAAQLELWRTELERVPEGGRLLMISHGGLIELGAAFALPEVVRGWGAPLGYLEGVRLVWDGRRWLSPKVLRVPP